MSYDPETFHQIADLQKRVTFLEGLISGILSRLDERDEDREAIDNEPVHCDTE